MTIVHLPHEKLRDDLKASVALLDNEPLLRARERIAVMIDGAKAMVRMSELNEQFCASGDYRAYARGLEDALKAIDAEVRR